MRQSITVLEQHTIKEITITQLAVDNTHVPVVRSLSNIASLYKWA